MIDWCLMPTLAVFQLYRVVLPLKQISNFTDGEWLCILVLLVSKRGPRYWGRERQEGFKELTSKHYLPCVSGNVNT